MGDRSSVGSEDAVQPELQSTYKMLKCAFPEDIPDELYEPLLWLLRQEMSIRQLAMLLALVTGTDYWTLLGHASAPRSYEGTLQV